MIRGSDYYLVNRMKSIKRNYCLQFLYNSRENLKNTMSEVGLSVYSLTQSAFELIGTTPIRLARLVSGKSFRVFSSIINSCDSLLESYLHPNIRLCDSCEKYGKCCHVKELIEGHGYPFENHTITTSDGYILDIHRIPYGKNSPPKQNETRPVALVFAGLWCDSSSWIVMGPEKGLGFLLADQGYDVWMGNARGTSPARKHTTLNPDKGPQFWDFSFHEMGVYDLPNTIDYVLAYTKQEKLTYIGHSQGTLMFFIMASEFPEYKEKFKVVIALAPPIYIYGAKTPLLTATAPLSRELQFGAKIIRLYELLRHTKFIELLSNQFCSDGAITQGLCAKIFTLFAGPSQQLNQTMIPVITTFMPAGASLKQIWHYFQFYNTGLFGQYNYGKRENMKRYGQPEPPLYNIESIDLPLAIYYGNNDYMAIPENVEQAIAQFPQIIDTKKVDNFNHIDFMWGTDVVTEVYTRLFKVIEIYK